MPALVMFLSCAVTWGWTIWWTNAHLTHALLIGTDRIHSNSCTKSQTHIGQHTFHLKQCKMVIIISRTDLIPPERPWIDSLSVTERCHAIQHTQITLQHELQFVSESQRSHQMPPKLFDLYFADATSSLFKLRIQQVSK